MFMLTAVVAMAIEPSSEVVVVNGKRYYVHTIEKGHTLYSLAKAYGVSEEDIMEANQGLEPSALGIGDRLYIPVREPSKREARSAKREAAAQAAVGEGEHLVLPGETVYSLSRRYGITEEQFLAWNGITASELKAGMKVRVAEGVESATAEQPVKEGRRRKMRETEQRDEREEPAQAEEPSVEDLAVVPELIDSLMGRGEADAYIYGDMALLDSLATQPLDVEFLRLGRSNTLKTVLMLPFHMRGRVNPNYVDFYRGVLLAMEDLKREGFDIDLTVFDTENSVTRIKDIVAYEDAMLDAQLIIGPVHEDELRHVLSHAEDNNIPVVTPLADIEGVKSPVLFQMQSEDDYRYEKFKELLSPERELITIYAASNDYAYAAEMMALVGDRANLKLNFSFHREPFLYYRNNDGSNGSLYNLQALLRTNTAKTFIVVADKDTDIDRILTTLASLRSSIVDRGAVIGEYKVIGNRKWARLENIDRQSFFKNNVAFLVPYHAKRSDDAIRLFDSRYLKAYRSLPSMFSYRGYDAAMIFCRQMFEGFDEGFTEQRYQPLAMGYRFAFEDGLYVNTEWALEQYTNRFTIQIK